MFGESVRYYDKFYAWKDYEAEAARLCTVIEEYRRSDGRRLLDVACGTGMHLPYVREHYEVEGLDIEPGFLAMARERNPGLVFHEGDMASFDLGQAYDVITCLFSSIGYVKTPDALNATIACFAAHLRPGGVAIVEPWFRPDQWQPGALHVLTVDEPELKLCRMNKSDVDADGKRSVLDFHYLVGTAEGVRHFTEHHELGLFTIEQLADAGAAAGLAHRHLDPDRHPDWGRGLHIYTKGG